MAVKNVKSGTSRTAAAVGAARAKASAPKPKAAASDASANIPAVLMAETAAAVEPPAVTPAPQPAVTSEAALAAPAIETAAKVAEDTAQTIEAAETATAETIATGSAAAEIAQEEVKTMQTEATQTFDAAANKGQAVFADMNDRAKAAMEKNAKMVEEMNDLAKGNIEALVESSRIAAKGFESLGHEAAEFGRKSFEQATATLKTMAQVKSPTELFKLQSDYMRSAFDAYVAEASKTTEQVMKLAGDAAQPLSNRMAVAADKVKAVA